MSEKLRAAYQRLKAKREAVAALGVEPRVVRNKRMMEKMIANPHNRVEYIREKPGMAWLPENCRAVGFREIGNVMAEPYTWRYRGWLTNDTGGWYTNNRGEAMRDGEGLVCGVVLAIPSYRRWGRFIA